jgi:hypothetical protein
MQEQDTEALDRAVRLYIYRHLHTVGGAPDVEGTAGALQVAPAAIAAAFERLAARHMIVLQPGTHALWMAMPFSAVPTAFEVTAEGRTWWANCAWDALGIPAMLPADAEIRTGCGCCSAPLTLQVQNGTPAPAEAVIHFALPAARWWDDIGFT